MTDFILLKEKNNLCIPIQEGAEVNISDNMSTNVIYPKTLYIISQYELLDIFIEATDICSILDISNLNNTDININDVNYYDISKLKVNKITSTGVKVDDRYLHILNLSLFSDIESDYILNLYVNNCRINLITSFYNQVEEYNILLQNIGVKLNPNISHAFYEGSVRDESVDYVLLNKKYKELLLNGLSIIECKGSYKSMLDSFDWFGWRDIANLREYWTNADSPRLQYRDICNDYYESFNSIIANNYKSTYLSIYTVCNELTGEYKSDNKNELVDGCGILKEPIPILQNKLFEFSNTDIKLKLMLLGNYFSSFFLPIHIDLISSTLESISVSNQLLKHISSTNLSRQDIVNNLLKFECAFDKTHYMHDVNVFSDDFTTAGSVYGLLDNNILIGCEDVTDEKFIDNKLEFDDISSKTIFTGFGSVVPITITPTKKCSDLLIKIEYDDKSFTSKNRIYKYEDNFIFNILFLKPGTYTIYIQPICLGSGTFRIEKINVTIKEPKSVEVICYDMVKKPIYIDINKKYSTEDGNFEYDSKYIKSNSDGSIEFTSEDNLDLRLFDNQYGLTQYSDNKLTNLSHNIINIKIDGYYNGTNDLDSIKNEKNWTYRLCNDGNLLKFYYTNDNISFIEINNLKIDNKFITRKSLISKLTTGYPSGSTNILPSLINRLSSYMFWVLHSFKYYQDTEDIDGVYLDDDNNIVGYIEDGKIYKYDARLVALRIVTNDIISATYPIIRINNTFTNSDDIFYKNELVPLMWEIGEVSNVKNIGSLFSFISKFDNLNIIKYELINKSTNEVIEIPNKQHILISYDNNYITKGIYDVKITYNISNTISEYSINNFIILQ